MFPHVVEVRVTGPHRVWVRFEDGRAGEIDLSAELEGEVFLPLADAEYFAKVTVHPVSRMARRPAT